METGPWIFSLYLQIVVSEVIHLAELDFLIPSAQAHDLFDIEIY
jgi:hypothetical protein